MDIGLARARKREISDAARGVVGMVSYRPENQSARGNVAMIAFSSFLFGALLLDVHLFGTVQQENTCTKSKRIIY